MNTPEHGTIKQHLRYMRSRQAALSILETPHHGETLPPLTPPPQPPPPPIKPKPAPKPAKEFKIVALRECPLPENMQVCDTPDQAAEYWRMHVTTHPYFNPEQECFVVLVLNTRKRIRGHHLVTIGTKDTMFVSPGEAFRVAIIDNAAAIVLMHNHPSGESTPSEADIKITRDFVRAGQLLKIQVLDHVIMGNGNRASLRELGYFYN